MPKELALLIVFVNVFVLPLACCVDGEINQTLDVDVVKLSKIEHGTELTFVEDGYNRRDAYKLEDFFWTGSGDGESGSDNQVHTEYKTKTVVSTIYVDTPSSNVDQTTKPISNCRLNCDSTITPTEEIIPTPTYDIIYGNTTDEYPSDTDRYFWLLTVLKSEGKHIVVTDLKNSLAKLYKIAFQRQQEHHLGINNRQKRDASDSDKPVNVFIHNVAKSPNNGDEKIEVLYHVAVSGQPVAAITAAADMHLVSDEEVTSELGYPFIIKAEPYLKVSDPQYLSTSNNTWVFIGVALSILFVLLLLVALVTLALSKPKCKKNVPSKVFQQDVDLGRVNKSFVSDGIENIEYKSGRRREASTYKNFRSGPSNETLKSGIILARTQYSSSSSSTVSVSSLDSSPIVSVKKLRTPKNTNLVRPKAAINRTIPTGMERRKSLVLDSDDSNIEKVERGSSDTIIVDQYDPGVVSPKSYLSMPSVNAFPRGNIPEPLIKILEPVSVLHLDIDDDIDDTKHKTYQPILTRHGSLSTIEDPGIIGPVVWGGYCKKLRHGLSADDKINDITAPNNAARMRKRFHELLDDTFSLFGSQRCSPVEEQRPISFEVKSKSALTNRPGDEHHVNVRPRPKTAVSRRHPPENEPPRGAWATNTPSPLSRPLSAGPFLRANTTPEVDVDRVLVEGILSPNDPAVPLIAAIKTELNRCSLPGSTTNLVV